LLFFTTYGNKAVSPPSGLKLMGLSSPGIERAFHQASTARLLISVFLEDLLPATKDPIGNPAGSCPGGTMNNNEIFPLQALDPGFGPFCSLPIWVLRSSFSIPPHPHLTATRGALVIFFSLLGFAACRS